MKEILGILGGVGPLASAEFLKTIYEFNVGAVEQESPVCILYSDPTIPNRTEAIISGTDEIVLESLVRGLEALCQLGASKLVIACVTMHYFLPEIPAHLRQKVISLLDLIIDEVLVTETRYLLLCTTGTRKTGIFQNHERWELIRPQVVLMNDVDQDFIHDLIHKKIKINCSDDSLLACFDGLSKRYQINSFIAGCTEIHLLVKRLMKVRCDKSGYRFVDPLLTFAKDLKRLLVHSSGSVALGHDK